MTRSRLQAAVTMWLCVWFFATVLANGAVRVSSADQSGETQHNRVRRQWGNVRNWGNGNGRLTFDNGDDYDSEDYSDSLSENWSQGGPGDFNFPGNRHTYGLRPGQWGSPPQRPQAPRPRPPAPSIIRTQNGGSGGGRVRPSGIPDEQRQSPGQNTRPASPGGGSTGRCGVTIEVPRIINGKEAQRGEYPWQAALIYAKAGEERAFCGGALVHPRWVLTAAHCLDPNTIRGYALVKVLLGLTDQKRVDAESRSFVPDRRIQHPQYSGSTSQGVRNSNDIALLRLPQAAPYTEFIRPVCLPSGEGAAANLQQTLVVAGWGLTEQGKFSDVLKFASVSPMDSGSCGSRLNVRIAESQLCAGGSRTDSCNGDSGGPLVTAAADARGETVFQVVGLVSFGPTNCATQGVPGAYTRVAAYRAWIDQVIREQS